MESTYWYQNKIFKDPQEIPLGVNRAFLYGDGVFESMIGVRGEIPWWKEHYQRLQKACHFLQIHVPEESVLKMAMNELFNQYSNVSVVRIRLTIFRKGEGRYIPVSNESQFLLEAQKTDQMTVHRIKSAGVFNDFKKYNTPWASFKSINAQFYVMAGMNMKSKGWDETIILNDHDEICEGLSSNIFWKIGGTWYTPSNDTGCVKGICRQFILLHHPAIQMVKQGAEILDKAEQIIFTNATQGLKILELWKDKILDVEPPASWLPIIHNT